MNASKPPLPDRKTPIGATKNEQRTICRVHRVCLVEIGGDVGEQRSPNTPLLHTPESPRMYSGGDERIGCAYTDPLQPKLEGMVSSPLNRQAFTTVSSTDYA
ncbi:hypothetical protein EGR_10063 [Echinococcus granulosus]|uniref:Uncharacterized protein n=1 Tax=Echinococcus granulosus TaxID=6210 RepID=W6U3D9_ECHGR|nr:hypothetical protein EGR_10063 [Echinococcus granulosus]EUB55066.1 hypothetical protein EGR_10063 [Echinococcus granulosus]